MGKRESLIDYITKYGRNGKTWDELAGMHGIHSGEAARHIWRRHRNEGGEQPSTSSVVSVASSVDSSKPMVDFEHDIKNNTAVLNYKGDSEIKSKDDLVRECKINLVCMSFPPLISNLLR